MDENQVVNNAVEDGIGTSPYQVAVGESAIPYDEAETDDKTMYVKVKMQLDDSELDGLEIIQDTKLVIDNTESIEIVGTPSERQEMFESWALYFGEVSNPDNTTLNAFFKAKYAPLSEVLNTIRPIMGKYGLSITQVPYISNGEVCVRTIVMHKGGAAMSFPIMSAKPAKADIQGIGSIITYIRRFVLNSIAGIAGEPDDDGNSASKGKKAEIKSREKTKEEIELENAQIEIIKLATGKIELGIDKDVVYGIISSNNDGKKNPKTVMDLGIAKKIAKEIKALKIEEKKEN